jgi:hypothetical protein
VDLFEPGSGSQVHDFNGGLLTSGLFWTLPVDTLHVGDEGRTAVLDVEDLEVVDSFTFGSGLVTPARLSMHIAWRATGPAVDRGQGTKVSPTDPAAFVGELAVAESTAEFAGSEFGFSFRSDPGVSTERGFAEIGRERNGIFL